MFSSSFPLALASVHILPFLSLHHLCRLRRVNRNASRLIRESNSLLWTRVVQVHPHVSFLDRFDTDRCACPPSFDKGSRLDVSDFGRYRTCHHIVEQWNFTAFRFVGHPPVLPRCQSLRITRLRSGSAAKSIWNLVQFVRFSLMRHLVKLEILRCDWEESIQTNIPMTSFMCLLTHMGKAHRLRYLTIPMNSIGMIKEIVQSRVVFGAMGPPIYPDELVVCPHLTLRVFLAMGERPDEETAASLDLLCSFIGEVEVYTDCVINGRSFTALSALLQHRSNIHWILPRDDDDAPIEVHGRHSFY